MHNIVKSHNHNIKQKKSGHLNSLSPHPHKPYTVWFHLYKVQKESKLIDTVRSQANSYPWWEGGFWPGGGKGSFWSCSLSWSGYQSYWYIQVVKMAALYTYDMCTQCVLMHVGFQYKVENINTSNAAVNILVAVSL